MEKALTDIQYWENWRQILNRLVHDLNGRYRDQSIQPGIEVLYNAISNRENEAWKHSFMWGLGQSEGTRRKILQKAKEKFLISDRDHVSFEIMSHLDPRFLIEGSKANEEDFQKAIREYFELEPTKKEEVKDEIIP